MPCRKAIESDDKAKLMAKAVDGLQNALTKASDTDNGKKDQADREPAHSGKKLLAMTRRMQKAMTTGDIGGDDQAPENYEHSKGKKKCASCGEVMKRIGSSRSTRDRQFGGG